MNYSFHDERSEITRFCEGDSVRAFDYFGAHPEVRDGKQGVMFRVWAPNAISVSVVGDFNDRDQESDPFAFFAQMRPNTASIIYELGGYEWNDGAWLEARSQTDTLTRPMNIYEVHLGSWKRRLDGGFCTYRDFADELVAYVTDMHYTHVQLMPIMEYPYDGSWGYQTTGYFAATSRYGEPKDFMYLVDKLHQAGIGVIVDWVPSNFPKDSFALAKFDGTALFEDENPKRGERPSWNTCLFNFERPEVLSFLVSCANFWFDVYHLDGMRVGSLSSMLYLDYGKAAGEWEPNKFGGKENLEAIEFVNRRSPIKSKRAAWALTTSGTAAG